MTLDVKIFLRKIDNVDKPGFTRALELINKSNQFNTTGRRWTRQEFNSAFAENTGMWIFDVEDRFTKYGIVGVVIVRDSVIVQFVMSCRVVGMEVEIAAITELLRIMGGGTITALLDETDLNLLVRDLWERCGFELEGGRWIHPRSPHLRPPQHVKIVVEADASQAMELTGF
jgi:FkbH-like protein